MIHCLEVRLGAIFVKFLNMVLVLFFGIILALFLLLFSPFLALLGGSVNGIAGIPDGAPARLVALGAITTIGIMAILGIRYGKEWYGAGLAILSAFLWLILALICMPYA
jgi:hypothetical protein